MTQRNRGKQSSDDRDFAAKWDNIFTEAANDLCFLLTRGYTSASALQLVGNRYKLNKRQRVALMRICSSEQELEGRNKSICPIDDLKGNTVEIDGFNLLILLESALSGAYIFKGRDGTFRDISSVHGSYKRVTQTEKAIYLIGEELKKIEVKTVKWYLDQPISNSGRLKTRLMEISNESNFNFEVDLVFSPDKVLAESKQIVVSSDGWILDQAEKWFNLGVYLIEKHIPDVNLKVY